MIAFEAEEPYEVSSGWNSTNPLGYPDHIWLQMLQNARKVIISDIENDRADKRTLLLAGRTYDLAGVEELIKDVEERMKL